MLTVTSIVNTTTSQTIEFAEKDFVIRDTKEAMHIEIISEQFYDELIGSEETFYINFDNGQTDTLLYGIDEVEGKCCDSYRDLKFIYNSDDLTGNQENTIGAYHIIKE